jgi:hypothetical protein
VPVLQLSLPAYVQVVAGKIRQKGRLSRLGCNAHTQIDGQQLKPCGRTGAATASTLRTVIAVPPNASKHPHASIGPVVAAPAQTGKTVKYLAIYRH